MHTIIFGAAIVLKRPIFTTVPQSLPKKPTINGHSQLDPVCSSSIPPGKWSHRTKDGLTFLSNTPSLVILSCSVLFLESACLCIVSAIDRLGVVDGGSLCRLLIIRNGNVALSILRKCCVALSIFQKVPWRPVDFKSVVSHVAKAKKGLCAIAGK